ncbi:hypothetical protein MHH81_20730 [Psychrobacillus sp. FSL H8-0484]|uniref:hypothetical protein n=1 Tax=Psychrobacillus sp. FSL H8-0484 TaxID=2921390 RepID=UPI0030FA861A
MGTFLFLMLIIAAVIMIGIMPVFSAISAEKRPSPWASTVVSSVSKSNAKVSSVIAATQTHVNVDIPYIPAFDLEIHTVDKMPEETDSAFMNMVASEPSNEGIDNISKLLKATMDVSVEVQDKNDLEVLDYEIYENLEGFTPLKDEEFQAISKQFGEKVAKTVTWTPLQGSSGPQIMIGQFFKEGNHLKFSDDYVELSGDVLEQLEKLDKEFLLVKGNFLNDGTFFVQHWEDPEMVAHGYSDFQMGHSKMIL